MARKRTLTLEDLFRIRAVGKVAISPDGSRVVFELKRAVPEKNKNFTQLMIAEVESGQVRPLTEGDHNDTRPVFSPDGRTLGFLSDREKVTALYLLPMDGGEPRRITDREGRVHDFAFSPDGRRIAYAYQPLNEREKLARDEKKDELERRPSYKHITRLFHKLDGVGYWNGQRTHIWICDVAGRRRRQLTRGDYDDSEPRFNPDGKLVSFVSNRTADPDRHHDQSDIFVVPAGGGRVRKITQGPGSRQYHAWSPDGRWIAYIGMPNRPGDWWKHDAHVWLVPAAGGRPRKLTTDIDRPCSHVTIGDVVGVGFETPPPIWSADGRTLYFLVSSEGGTYLYRRSVGRNGKCERVFDGRLHVYWMHAARADGPIAMAIGTATNPGDVFVIDPAAGSRSLRQISGVNRDLLDRVQLAEPRRFTVRNGRTEIEAWELRPVGFNPRRKYPAILEIHGGPQAQYGYNFFHEMQWLAACGYVVVFGNPRGSAGYGEQFKKCIGWRWGTLDYQDVMKIADWLFRRPYVDRRRVGVTGGSYGGFMTNWIIGHTDRFRAAVTQRSCVDFISMYGTSDIGYGLAEELGGTPWRNWQRLRQQSPLTYVKRARTPTLIIHSEQDLRCPIDQAQELFIALKYLGCEVELVQFEGESHGLSRGGRPQNRAERLRRIRGWFERYMK